MTLHADGEKVDYELHSPFRECRLVSMTTAAGERGIARQMRLSQKASATCANTQAEDPLPCRQPCSLCLWTQPTNLVFSLRWDEETRNWRSEFAALAELHEEIPWVFDGFGYGCLAAETNIGVVQVAVTSPR